MDQLTVLVKPGADLPNPGTLLAASSPLTGLEYDIKVKSIKRLRWNTKTGDLIVEVIGTKQLYKGERKNGPEAAGDKK